MTRLGNFLSNKTFVTLVVLATLSTTAARAESDNKALPGGGLSSSSLEPSADNSRDSSSKLSPREKIRVARAHFDKGLQHKQSGDSGRALIEFLKASREDPQLIDAYYEQAIIFREKGFHKLACSRLEQVLAIKPKYQKARVLLATLKLEQGQLGDAVQQLGESIGLPGLAATSPLKGENEDRLSGTPPMLLQALHTALPMPLPAVTVKKTPENDAAPAATTEDETGSRISKEMMERETEEPPEAIATIPREQSTKSQPSKRRRGKSNRQKIRETLAKRYRKFHKETANKRVQKHWIAKIFSWPDSFKEAFGDKSLDDKDTDSNEGMIDLLPKDSAKEVVVSGKPTNGHQSVLASNTTERKTKRNQLWNEFENDDSDNVKVNLEKPAQAWDEWENEHASPSRRNGKTLIAYNGNPEDTIGLLQENNKSTPQKPAQDAAQRTNKLAYRPAQPTEERAEKPVAKKVLVQILDDEWTKRLTYLNEHGTGTLKAGEAFMFSEDTGEAVLFLSDGSQVRRTIAQPMDMQDLIKERRPDVLTKDLQYNTSLAGKVVKSTPPAVPQSSSNPFMPPRTGSSGLIPQAVNPSSEEPPTFKIEQMMENSSGFVNWLKGLVNL